MGHDLQQLISYTQFPVNGYWMYKYRNVSDPSNYDPDVPSAHNHTHDDHPEMSPLQIQWSSYLSIASMIPNVTFLLLNAVFGHRFPTQPRLVVAILVIIVVFVFTDVMAVTDTDAWQGSFLAVTLASVVVVNVMVAIFQVGKQIFEMRYFVAQMKLTRLLTFPCRVEVLH